MYLQPLDGSLNPSPLSPLGGGESSEGALFQGFAAPGAAGDNIARMVPPWLNGTNGTIEGSGYGDTSGYGSSGSMQGMFGSLMGMLAQMMQMLQSMMGYGGGSQYGNGGCTPYGNEQFFPNASGGSDGDPHLSFNANRWNSMVSQPDLLNSDSIPGGFQISTQVTAPNAKGVTHNQSATISMNGGATTVSMNADGQATITNYGQTVSVAAGQTVALGNGESVTCKPDGSLEVVAQNGMGGKITTTLAAKEHGVNVDVTAHDVDLGGALVDGSGQSPVAGPTSGPVSGPISGPIDPIAAPISGGPIAGPIVHPSNPRMYPDLRRT